MINASYHIAYFAPVILLTVWALGLLLAEAFIPLTPRQTAWTALAGLLLTGLLTLAFDTGPWIFWSGLCKWDGAAKFFNLFFVATAMLVIWMGDEVQEPVSHDGGEFVVLPLFTTIGLMLLAMANDFMLLFVALELVTISFYILVAYQRRNPAALEAGIKYLILGGLSSAFLIMGIAYIFGLTGTTRFDAIALELQFYLRTGVAFGMLLVLIGIGFKIAMVPFHIWAPDVYEGAPNSITAFLSVGSKAGGFIILMRVVLGVFGGPAGVGIWVPVLSVVAILSLILGNLAAIPQRNLKRLLGYSSIGHTGFILVAVIGAVTLLPGQSSPLYITDRITGQIAVSVYLVTYLLATFTAFIVLAVLNRRLPGLEIHHLAGLSQRSPLLAAAFALSLISLAGVPPLSGFVAKLMVILVAWNHGLYTLLFFVIFAAVAALYYYLGPIKAMYWSEPLDETPIRVNLSTTIVLYVLIVLLIGTGFWAQSFSSFVNNSYLAHAATHAAGSLAFKQ
ncbi:MAG: NADH-quinone oxidoreductase subunit N [Methylacidiphilales bacterium]|nr:NADH-quinone oxidoreductase subunit N [Candidatus Methylacidiphilales bacterium]